MTDQHETKFMTDRQRAFKAYKDATKKYGKPFFPHGVWHDAIASLVVVVVIILMAVTWFSMANCGTWGDISCHAAATPAEQVHHLSKAGVHFGSDTYDLGPLYESKADPSTTSYDPRPEWYFFFLFQLLRVFKNPNVVILGTIGVPTILLVLLLAWPFLDTRRERRPSRRPLAMTGMVATAVVLLGLTWQGAHAPKVGGTGGPTGMTTAQKAMPGFKILFGPGATPACANCHTLAGAWSATVGPNLTSEASRNRGLAWQIAHLNDPQSKTPGSGMPSASKALGYNQTQIAQIAGFLETLGKPARASDPAYVNPTPSSGEGSGTSGGKGTGPAGSPTAPANSLNKGSSPGSAPASGNSTQPGGGAGANDSSGTPSTGSSTTGTSTTSTSSH